MKLTKVLKKIKVYDLFWIVATLILLIGLSGINNPDNTFDINVHDTYFVIAHFYGAVLFSLFYFLNGLGYWLVLKVYKKHLITSLTTIHTVILIGSFIFYWLVILCSKLIISINPFPLFDNYQLINITLTIEFLLSIFVAIPAFLINLLIGLFRKV